jgi:hypothetical protein
MSHLRQILLGVAPISQTGAAIASILVLLFSQQPRGETARTARMS